MRYALLTLILWGATAFAASEKPSGAEIKAALERGKIVRDVKELIPAALGKNAFVIKINGVRCGHGITTLEDAKGEGGAIYKLTEEARSAQADDETARIYDYKGTYLLNSRLGLVSGTLHWKETTKNLAEKKDDVTDESCSMRVEKDALKWEANVGGEISKDSTPLNGETPIPQSILCTLAAFLGKSSDGFGKPLCVPELSPRADKDSFDIQTAWITFDQAKDKPVAGFAKLIHLVGAPERKEIEGLTSVSWSAPQILTLDGVSITSYPAAAPGIDVEPIAPEKLDPEASLDLAKIAAAANDVMGPKKP